MSKKRTIDPATKQRYNKKHAQKLKHDGLVSTLLYVKVETKPFYEDQVYQRSKEYVTIDSQTRRERQAKIDMFEEFVRHQNHDYWALREENKQLQRENAALAPAFLHDKNLDHVPIPSAIQHFEDDPKKLKQRLTVWDCERKQAKKLLNDYQDQAKRARMAQELAEKRVERLEQRLIDHGLSTEVEVLI